MRILIAGGAGFIGSHLVDALLEAGHKVACVDNLCGGSRDMIKAHLDNPSFVFHEMDICDSDGLNSLFAAHTFERVYHLAANSDIRKGGHDPSIDLYNTLGTTSALLTAMREHGVNQMLFASTSAVYGAKSGALREDEGCVRPVSYYGGAKLASEALICAFAAMNDMRVNVLRFANVVGPRLTHGAVFDFVAKLKSNPRELEILGDGRQEKPYIYAADLIRAIMCMRWEPGVEIFNTGVESATTVTRIADIVCEEMGLTGVNYRYGGGSVGWKGDVARFQYDLSKIHALGWRARHTSDEAVRLAVRDVL